MRKVENAVKSVSGDGRAPSIVLEALQQDQSVAAHELLALAPQAKLRSGAVRSVSAFPNARILVVEEGFVILRATDPASGRGAVICHGGAGTFLPFIAPSQDIVALVDSRVTVITVDIHEQLLELPGAAQALLRGIEATVRQKQRTILALASSHHVDRLREKLLQLAEDHGRVGRDGVVLKLPVTHELLAEMIGSTRETVTRAVDALEQDGFLRRQGRGYVLRVSPGALERQK
ncbi:MAG TPA: Crp/Fnr family transcriptional regulator [Gaiella sp.]|jgi:CRP-like cAMP-binding protein|nr:Crp/Fnr family transcriptional regulator [Gaiella sp.]